ncbi:hypothetical protein CYMTET_30114, partial [Cymbomonas tetramitiformis]
MPPPPQPRSPEPPQSPPPPCLNAFPPLPPPFRDISAEYSAYSICNPPPQPPEVPPPPAPEPPILYPPPPPFPEAPCSPCGSTQKVQVIVDAPPEEDGYNTEDGKKDEPIDYFNRSPPPPPIPPEPPMMPPPAPRPPPIYFCFCNDVIQVSVQVQIHNFSEAAFTKAAIEAIQ